MERALQWMRRHDLSNRYFKDEAEIDRPCEQRWNNLTPERLKKITATDWITHENLVGLVIAPTRTTRLLISDQAAGHLQVGRVVLRPLAPKD